MPSINSTDPYHGLRFSLWHHSSSQLGELACLYCTSVGPTHACMHSLPCTVSLRTDDENNPRSGNVRGFSVIDPLQLVFVWLEESPRCPSPDCERPSVNRFAQKRTFSPPYYLQRKSCKSRPRHSYCNVTRTTTSVPPQRLVTAIDCLFEAV